MRLVLDTNILISAMFWDGNERRLLMACRKKKHQLITSGRIIEETDAVLERKFNVPVEIRRHYLRNIILISEMVEPTGEFHLVKEHPADDKIIETAIIGKADALITGDKHLLKIGKIKDIVIKQASKL